MLRVRQHEGNDPDEMSEEMRMNFLVVYSLNSTVERFGFCVGVGPFWSPSGS